MPSRLIRGNRVVQDDYAVVALSAGDDPATVSLPAGRVIVPLAVWAVRRGELLARADAVGVQLSPTDVPSALGEDLARLAVVAVHFPKFADGRGYSIAYQLRRRLGYRGELRAVGDVQRDQLFYLSRSGFDAFLIKEGHDAQSALASLHDFAATYQAAADGRLPRFRAPSPDREAIGG
jgi:uncharacterized protein (DUF934 family)